MQDSVTGSTVPGNKTQYGIYKDVLNNTYEMFREKIEK